MATRFSNRLWFVALYCLWLLLVPQKLCAEDAVPAEQAANTVSEPNSEDMDPDEARDREQGAEEDPLAQKQDEAVEAPDTGIIERADLNLYGSVRIRYRETDLGAFAGDAGSRVGLSGGWRFKPELRVFGRGEAGINVLDQLDFLFSGKDRPQGTKFNDTIFLRLLHVGVETPDYVLTAGKNWSTYYRVSSFTDRFQGVGGNASGTYNAGTDGGYTGTGRADRVLQARIFLGDFEDVLPFKPLGLGLQIQHGEPIPESTDKNYKTTVGVSSVYETDGGLTFGFAYNHASIDDADLVALRAIGIDGDATALVLGARWYGDRWYLGTIAARLKNHETTDEGIYFDGTGWEVYGQYNVVANWWAIAGWNNLTPDAGEVQAGDFQINYGVVGVRYSFQKFQKMVFANVRIEYGEAQDGLQLGEVYTVGIRWDLP